MVEKRQMTEPVTGRCGNSQLNPYAPPGLAKPGRPRQHRTAARGEATETPDHMGTPRSSRINLPGSGAALPEYTPTFTTPGLPAAPPRSAPERPWPPVATATVRR